MNATICISIVMTAMVAFTADVAAQRAKCVAARDGRCVVVQVNGQISVALRKPTKKLLQGIKAGYASDARYELTMPVYGEIDVRADGVPGSAWWFGELEEADVSVVPLQDVDLKTHQERTTHESVRVGGTAAVTERSMLDGNRLPPGKYLMVVTLRGTSNWDRQVLYFEVAEE
jgi:hypothetical protein